MKVSDRSKIIYLLLLIPFLLFAGLFWLDYIGLLSISSITGKLTGKESPSVLYASDDEPSLIAKEEFEKEREKIDERVEDLDRREALISEEEKKLQSEREKLDEQRRGIELERKKLENEKKQWTGYRRNVEDLARKIESMPPDKSIEILIRLEDPLIIDVLRQMDANATEAGKTSITSYLISLMPKEKASRIMYLMTQI